MKLAVTCVTYNNSPVELQRFAHAYRKAKASAARQGLGVQLVYRDNGGVSGLAALVDEPLAELGADGVGASSADNTADSRNIGYGPAMAQLWSEAFGSGAQAVVTANPDGGFHPDCLLRLHQAALLRPGHLIEARQFPSEHPKAYDPISGSSAWASGCCVYVSRDLFARVGNLDAGFWLYMEDVDYSWRVRDAGRQVLLCPTALYAHDTINRGHSPRAHQEMLVAARRLAWKWGNPSFQQQCEQLLHSQYPKVVLPNLGEATPPTASQAAIADFSKPFLFAPSRWTL
jgi:N-acetylglucosaminyl-diphospho-decaprenol L-rhamnosyltransferase